MSTCLHLLSRFRVVFILLLLTNETFRGGTIVSLLQMIHEFYQGPATSEEVNGILNNLSSQSPRRERFIRLLERQEAGEIIRRIDVLGRASTCEEIRDSKLLVE